MSDGAVVGILLGLFFGSQLTIVVMLFSIRAQIWRVEDKLK